MDHVVIGDTTFIALSLLIQHQGDSKPVNTLGIVVAVDEHNLQITDWSRRDLTPIRVERDASSPKGRNNVSKHPGIETERVVDKGDCLLLSRFFVWFDLEREGLPYLRKRSAHGKPAGTSCIWRYGSDQCIQCNRAIGASELQEMSKLHSWWRSNRKIDK
jgi:hypothetical protein